MQPHWVAIVTVLVPSWPPAYLVTYQVSFNLDTNCHSNRNFTPSIAELHVTVQPQLFELQLL